MSTTYRFIADPAAASDVLNWFRGLDSRPDEIRTSRAAVFHFKVYGPLVDGPDGAIDAKRSPVVSVFSPRVRRGILWTVGEVHFHPTPLREQFPHLHKTSTSFAKWLRIRPCVFSNARKDNEHNYYLEGSVRNYDPPVYAFESGLKALNAQRYFVGNDDTESCLEDLCRTLRLRGVNCDAQQAVADDRGDERRSG